MRQGHALNVGLQFVKLPSTIHISAMTTIEELKQVVGKFDQLREGMQKLAFTPMAPPAPPATAGPPPGAMPPPGDPSAMPPGAPPMDPNAMPPGAPPMDPNAMPPGDPSAMPPPPGDPAMAGGPPPPPGPEAGGAPPPGANPIPPELEGLLSELAQGMGGMSQAVEAQQANLDTLTDRLLKIEEEISNIHDEKQQAEVREQLKQPAGLEGIAGGQDMEAPAEEGAPQPKPDLPLR